MIFFYYKLTWNESCWIYHKNVISFHGCVNRCLEFWNFNLWVCFNLGVLHTSHLSFSFFFILFSLLLVLVLLLLLKPCFSFLQSIRKFLGSVSTKFHRILKKHSTFFFNEQEPFNLCYLLYRNFILINVEFFFRRRINVEFWSLCNKIE